MLFGTKGFDDLCVHPVNIHISFADLSLKEQETIVAITFPAFNPELSS